jgi:hypothetical protein
MEICRPGHSLPAAGGDFETCTTDRHTLIQQILVHLKTAILHVKFLLLIIIIISKLNSFTVRAVPRRFIP